MKRRADALTDAAVRDGRTVTLAGQLRAVVTSQRWVDITVRVGVGDVVEVER